MDLEKFRSQIATQGLARTSKFVVRIFPPRGLTATGQAISNLLNTGGNNIGINLPIFDAIDDAIDQINDLRVTLGPFSVDFNPDLPTLGYAISNTGDTLESLSLFTDTVAIPGRDIDEYEYTTVGERTSIGFMHNHEGTLNMEYYLSEDLREKDFFEEWQKIIYNKDIASVGYYKEYTSRIDVIKYNANFSKKTVAYRFNDCYVTNIGGLDLNQEADSLLKLSVNFKFRNYDRIEQDDDRL